MCGEMRGGVCMGVGSYRGMGVWSSEVVWCCVGGRMVVDGGGLEGKRVRRIVMGWVFRVGGGVVVWGGV